MLTVIIHSSPCRAHCGIFYHTPKFATDQTVTYLTALCKTVLKRSGPLKPHTCIRVCLILFVDPTVHAKNYQELLRICKDYNKWLRLQYEELRTTTKTYRGRQNKTVALLWLSAVNMWTVYTKYYLFHSHPWPIRP